MEAALPRLLGGKPVTTIALDVGYGQTGGTPPQAARGSRDHHIRQPRHDRAQPALALNSAWQIAFRAGLPKHRPIQDGRQRRDGNDPEHRTALRHEGVKRSMRRVFIRWSRRAVLLSLVIVATLLVYRAVNSQRGPPLEPWHTFVPDDAHAAAIDKMDWAAWMAAEGHVFDQVKTEVSDRLDESDRTLDNRYFPASPVYPGHFARIGTVPTSSCRTALHAAPSCCCMA